MRHDRSLQPLWQPMRLGAARDACMRWRDWFVWIAAQTRTERFRQRSRTTQMVCRKKDRATLRWPEMPVAVVDVGGSDKIRTHGGGETPTAVYSSYGRCSDRWFRPLTHTSVDVDIAQFSVISSCLVSGTCILPEKSPPNDAHCAPFHGRTGSVAFEPFRCCQ